MGAVLQSGVEGKIYAQRDNSSPGMIASDADTVADAVENGHSPAVGLQVLFGLGFPVEIDFGGVNADAMIGYFKIDFVFTPFDTHTDLAGFFQVSVLNGVDGELIDCGLKKLPGTGVVTDA